MKLVLLFLVLGFASATAQTRVGVIARTDGRLLTPTNLFTPGTNLHAGAGIAMAKNGNGVTISSSMLGAGAATVTNIYAASASLNFPNLDPFVDSDLAVTVAGAVSGDLVIIGPPIPAAGVFYSGFASNGVVFVRAFNLSVGSVDPGAATFKVMVIKTQ